MSTIVDPSPDVPAEAPPALGVLPDILPDVPREDSPALGFLSELDINFPAGSHMSVDSVNPYESPDPDSPMPGNGNTADSEASLRVGLDVDLSPNHPLEILFIGHSTLPLPSLIQLLRLMRVSHIVDVRASPVSEVSPQFNFGKLKSNYHLMRAKIGYLWLGVSLGGRREHMEGVIRHREMLVPDLKNYAAYMTTPEFKAGMAEVKMLATQQAAKGKRIVIMCEEAVHWRCHRRMIADRLVADNWIALPMGLRAKESEKHVMWNIARVALDGELVYDVARLVS